MCSEDWIMGTCACMNSHNIFFPVTMQLTLLPFRKDVVWSLLFKTFTVIVQHTFFFFYYRLVMRSCVLVMRRWVLVVRIWILVIQSGMLVMKSWVLAVLTFTILLKGPHLLKSCTFSSYRHGSQACTCKVPFT